MLFINKKYLSFIVGLFSWTQVRVVGTFAISEFIIFGFVFYIIISNPIPFQKLLKSRRMQWLFLFCFLWIITIFFSDQINESSTINSLKGIGSVIPLLFIFIFYYWLFYDNLSLMGPFLWGATISFVISLFVFVSPALQSTVDAAGADSLSETGTLFSRLIVGAMGRATTAYSFQGFSSHPFFVLFLQTFMAIYALINGSRSTFLIGLISVLVLSFFAKYSKFDQLNIRDLNFIRKKIPFLFILILIGGGLAGKIYSYTAEKGYLGEENKKKYEIQSESKIGLLSGRGEIVAASLAIADAPWFGHGSYALDEEGYEIEAAILTGDQFIDFIISEKGENQIPSHSHLIGAWVFHGILGAVFWLYVLSLIITFLFKYVYIFPKRIAYLLPTTVSTIWTILFSPFSARPVISAFIILVIVIMDQVDVK